MSSSAAPGSDGGAGGWISADDAAVIVVGPSTFSQQGALRGVFQEASGALRRRETARLLRSL